MAFLSTQGRLQYSAHHRRRLPWEDLAEATAFVQRWAYWGMIFEIFQVGGLQGLAETILGAQGQTDPGADRLRSFSNSLPYLILLWQCIHIDPKNPDAEEVSLTRFAKISVILKRINLFYTLLCNREFSMRHSKEDNDVVPRKAQLIFAKHSHQKEEPGSWDDYAKNRLGGKRSFFSNEPYSGSSLLESPGHALILSIGVAGELLCRAAEQKYERKIEGLKWTVPLIIVRRLSLAGWCPVWLRRLRDEGSTIRAYYLSSISRRPTDRHARCCSFGRIASQVDALTYQIKHKNEGCQCQTVSFDLGEQSEYTNWIRSGHVPLIVRRVEGANDSVKWKLIRSHDLQSDKTKKYVAMSHVWVDGTGSTNGNALLSCQLEKFQNAATQLYSASGMDEPVPFWVDTICVPFNKGPLKKLAIRQMEQVYRNADKVLVFDSGLEEVTLGTPASECLTQIEISSWNERLWTIQEAVFAKTLHFQFKDGLTGIQELIFRYRLDRFARMASLRHGLNFERVSRGMPLLKVVLDMHLQPVLKGGNKPSKLPGVADGEWLALDADALEKAPSETEMEGLQLDTIFLGTVVAVSNFFNTLQMPPVGSERAQIKWSSLEKVLPYRQTSIASDEGLCISTLLGIDLNSLYDLPDEERVRRMFLHIGTISSGILFGSRPRLEQPGYRWMPSTFVSQRVELSDMTAQVTEAGVKVKLPGLSVIFPPGEFMLPVQPGNIEGHFGFHELARDAGEGERHLVAGAFPIRLLGTDQMYTVHLALPDGGAGIIAPRSTLTIILEQQLTQNGPAPVPGPTRSLSHTVLEEWKQLRKKSLAEAFLVDPATKNRGAVGYRVPAMLTDFDDPTPRQLATAALATQLEDIEWLISSTVVPFLFLPIEFSLLPLSIESTKTVTNGKKNTLLNASIRVYASLRPRCAEEYDNL